MKVTAMTGKYLKSEDLAGEVLTGTIARVVLRNLANEGEPAEEKWVVYFQEDALFGGKGLVLNKTNITNLSELGDDTDLWLGRKVEVYIDKNVMFQGRKVSGLRVRPLTDEPVVIDEDAPSALEMIDRIEAAQSMSEMTKILGDLMTGTYSDADRKHLKVLVSQKMTALSK